MKTKNPGRRQAGARASRALAAGVLASALTGCVTAPVDQIKYFSDAFNTLNTMGQPLLDDLAVAERTQGRQIAVRRAQGKSAQGAEACPPGQIPWQGAADGKQGIIRGFCLPDAPYFSGLADPPATHAIRSGLSVIERFAGILSTLAEGRNVEGALADIDALGKQVGGLLSFAGIAAPALVPALSALHPLLESAARQSNAQEAKRLILQAAPEITNLIGALEKAVPEMFKTLIESTSAKLTSEADMNPAIAAIDIARVEAYRVALSDYVILLRKLQMAWDLTVTAANSPGRASIANVVQQAAELKTDAEAARRVFSILRSGVGVTPAQ
jgi:hypothetical protein